MVVLFVVTIALAVAETGAVAAGINVPGSMKRARYDTVEGRSHYLVLLHREFLLVGRFGLQHRGVRLVGGLLRNYLLANEFLIADVGNVLNPIERARIRHLLVRLRRFNDRDNLSGALRDRPCPR